MGPLQVLLAIFAIVAMAMPSGAQELVPASPPVVRPQNPTLQWRVQCSDVLCEMVYDLAPGQAQSPSRVLIYDVGDLTILEYIVPLGIGLKTGIVVQVDGVHSFPTQMLVCRPTGCMGYLKLDERIVGLFKAGAKFTLAFENYSDKKFYSYRYSLMGFTAAYNIFINNSQKINQ